MMFAEFGVTSNVISLCDLRKRNFESKVMKKMVEITFDVTPNT